MNQEALRRWLWMAWNRGRQDEVVVNDIDLPDNGAFARMQMGWSRFSPQARVPTR